MRRRAGYLFLCLLVLFTGRAAADEKIHALVLHSYHENLPWTRGLMKGFYGAFDASGLNVEFHIEYMDHLRHFRDNIFPDLEALYRNKFRTTDVALILVTDDIALDFILKRRGALFPGVPVVFCGPNDFSPARLAGERNITGVAENPDFEGTVRLAVDLHPKADRVYIVSDREPAAMNRLKQLETVMEKFKNRAAFQVSTDESLDKVKDELRVLPDNAIVFYMLFLRDSGGRKYASGLSVLKELVAVRDIPFYTYKKVDVGNGAVGGRVISEELMAARAGAMAVRILRGESADDIPVVTHTPTLALFDYRMLEKYGLRESNLPENGVLVNKPFSFYETYRRLVWGVIAVIAVLTGFILLLSINIMRRKRAEMRLKQSVAKYRGIFKNAAEGIYQTTPDGRIIEANPAFARILGYETPEDVMREIVDLATQAYAEPGARERVTGLIRERGFVKGFETLFKRKDGALIHVSISGRAVRDAQGSLRWFEGVLEDVTAKKEHEALKISKERAEAANQAKSEFLAKMSHEIRTPMNAVIGLTDLALKTPLNPKQEDYLRKIGISARTLLGLINDILDLSKIEAGKLELMPVSFYLRDVLENLSDMFADKAAQKALDFRVSADASVPEALFGDPLRLEQILINLTGNALKFTETGHVRVSVAVAEKDAGCVLLRFSVADTGVGIDPELIPDLFSPFTQAEDSLSRKHEGTGLGLAICKQLVNRMGGDIRADSAPGRGSAFHFTIRFGLTDAKSRPAPGPPADLEGLRVLVVDDDDVAREMIRNILVSFNFRIDAAASGREALNALVRGEKRGAPYGLVILDWNMPGMNGIETAQNIKADPRLQTIPLIIMVTAHGREDIMEKAEKIGLNAFLVKPVNPSLILDAILQAFDGRAGEKNAARHGQAGLPATSERLAGKRILLAEDNVINRQVAVEVLQAQGAAVTTAVDGGEAVRAALAEPFDAILMDIQMPEMNGYEAAREIRRHYHLKDIPIIAMTAHALEQHRQESRDAGMNDFVTKPFDPKELFATLHRRLRADPAKIAESRGAAPPVRERGASGEVDLPDTLPGIDVRAGVDRLARNQALYVDLLREFQQAYVDAGATVRQDMERGDPMKAARLLHSLRGAAGHIGALDILESASALETAIETDDPEWMTAFDLFQDRLSLALNGILDFLAQQDKPRM